MFGSRAGQRRVTNVQGLSDVLSIGASILVIAVVLAFLFSGLVRQAVGVTTSSREWLFLVGGFALGVGTLVALDDRISRPITSRNFLGVLAMLVGAYLLFGQTLIPLGLAVWTAIFRVLTPWHVVAGLMGILLLGIPGYVYYRRRRP